MTTSKSPIVRPVPKVLWWLLATIAVSVYFFGLTIPFLGPDEARYAQVAREMMERGDWITPTLGGFHWFEKPALLYWLEIVSYKIFGVNEFAARFGPAIFGLGTVASLWVLGHNLKAEDNQKSRFANYLALIAASTLGLIVFARGASFDIIITFPITAGLVSFFIFEQRSASKERRPKTHSEILPLVLFYVFIGIALLAKGLIGIVFPFAIVGFYYVLSWRVPSRTFLTSLIWGTLISAVIAAIWYFPVYQQNGYEFFNEFIIQHHFQRFTSNKYKHPQPFYFFFWVLPLMTLPWLPFFVAATWKAVKSIFQRKVPETQRERDENISQGRLFKSEACLVRFAAAWLLVPLVFFSISGSKLPGYILPSVPAAIILTVVYMFKLVIKSTRWRNMVIGLSIGVFGTVVLLLTFALPHFADSDSVKSLVQAANERGYSDNRILMFHTVSHNAEFYAAGRLLRDELGNQKKFTNAEDIRAEILIDDNRPALVMVPPQQVGLLSQNGELNVDILKQNSELALAIVSTK